MSVMEDGMARAGWHSPDIVPHDKLTGSEMQSVLRQLTSGRYAMLWIDLPLRRGMQHD